MIAPAISLTHSGVRPWGRTGYLTGVSWAFKAATLDEIVEGNSAVPNTESSTDSLHSLKSLSRCLF